VGWIFLSSSSEGPGHEASLFRISPIQLYLQFGENGASAPDLLVAAGSTVTGPG